MSKSFVALPTLRCRRAWHQLGLQRALTHVSTRGMLG